MNCLKDPSLPLLELQVGCFTARGADEGGERGVAPQSAPPRPTGGLFTARGVDEGRERGVTPQSAPPRTTDRLFHSKGCW